MRKIDAHAEVILFGSRARGDFRSDSDWDFLILLSRPLTPELETLILDTIYDIELETEEIITPIVEYKPEWEKYVLTGIYQNIAAEGQVVELN